MAEERKTKKETKAQRVERIKKEKNGLDVIADIYRYAKTGEEIDPEDIDRLKWYGFYTQNRNLQDEDDDTLYFMLRIKLEGGELNLEQLETIVNITEKYTNHTADFTTRQTIQVHFVKMKDVPEIFRLLEEVGISTVYASGDVPRNIISCAINGIDKHEIADVRHIVEDLNKLYKGNREFSNLPRKFKVGVSGCSVDCINHEIQDLSFVARRLNQTIVYSVYVGGGLASNKQISHYLGYINEEQIINVATNVAKIFRDSQTLRENRRKARLGHLISKIGIEAFKEILEEKIGFKFDKVDEPNYKNSKQRDHFGVNESKIEGKSYIACSLYAGHIGYKGLKNLLDLCKKYGATKLKAMTTQNIVILDAPSQTALEFAKDLQAVDIEPFPSNFRARTQACTGIDFCKFAVSETKGTAKKLIQYLESSFPNFKEKITISVNGCINSCSQPHIVDFGLVGTKVRVDGQTTEGFELLLNGYLEGSKSNFAQKTGIKFAKNQVNENIASLIQEYQNSSFKNLNEFLQTKVKVKA